MQQEAATTGGAFPVERAGNRFWLSRSILLVTWSETDVNSTYGCETNPATTPQCRIEPLKPVFTALN